MSVSVHCECQERGVNIKTLQVNRRGRLLHSMTENKILIYLHDTYWWRSLSSVCCYEEGVVFRFVRNHVIDFTRTDFHSHWIKYSYQRHFMLITTTFFPMFWMRWRPLQLELPSHNCQWPLTNLPNHSTLLSWHLHYLPVWEVWFSVWETREPSILRE